MYEAQLRCVQCRPQQLSAATPVYRVAQHRMPDVRHVHTDLVRPPRTKTNLEQARIAQPLDDAEIRDGRAPPVDDGHALPVAGIPADGSVDGAARLAEAAADDGPIRASQRVIAQLGSQCAVRRLGLRDDEQPAGVAVQPVHDAGALLAPDQRPRRAARLERIRERARRMTGAGWTTMPAGLSTTASQSSSYTMLSCAVS